MVRSTMQSKLLISFYRKCVINAFHAYQVPSFCLLQSVYLTVCYVHVSVCASVQLEMHRLENTNKITYVRALTCTTFHFIFNVNVLLLYNHDEKQMPVFI